MKLGWFELTLVPTESSLPEGVKFRLKINGRIIWQLGKEKR